MKSGAPAFGTPEYMRATNACASNAPDGQAMWESCNSLWAAVQSGVNLVYHAAGWLEDSLNECEPPAIDPAIDEDLRAFVAKRKQEGGAPTDF